MRLTLLSKIAEGLVQAIPPDLHLTPMKEKRHIKPKVFQDCKNTNIVTKYKKNNSRPFVIPQGATNVYTQSFFVRTVGDWNHLGNDIVTAGSLDSFKAHLKKNTNNVHTPLPRIMVIP